MEGRCLQKAVTSRAAKVPFVVHLGILELADNSPIRVEQASEDRVQD